MKIPAVKYFSYFFCNLNLAVSKFRTKLSFLTNYWVREAFLTKRLNILNFKMPRILYRKGFMILYDNDKLLHESMYLS